jgi:hypothetical protein
MPKRYYKNHEAFMTAIERSHQLYKWAEEVQMKRGKNPLIKYDERNLFSLAMLITDMSGVAEENREKYFKAEYTKIHQAFDTSDPNQPNRPDPQKIKPYVEKMYQSVLTDLDNIDCDDPTQIQWSIHSFLSTQMLSTIIEDYPAECMDFFPTHADRARVDAICVRAYALQLQMQKSLYEEKLNVEEYFKTIGKNMSFYANQSILEEQQHGIFDATLQKKDFVMLDPAVSDTTAKFFMKKPLMAFDDYADNQGPVTVDENAYAKHYVDQLAAVPLNTAFSYQILNAAVDGSSILEKEDILVINGKPLSQIYREQKVDGIHWQGEREAAGRILRDALLNGEPVTVLNLSVSKDGKVEFQNKDIRLDLDKLNQLDREQNHNIIRRALDTIGLWPIPPKYPSNKVRDEKLSAALENPDSVHQKQVKAIEDELIQAYNNIDRSKSSSARFGCATVIPKLTREEVKTSQRSADTETSKEKDTVRQRLPVIEAAEKHSTELVPPHRNEEKTPHRDLTQNQL